MASAISVQDTAVQHLHACSFICSLTQVVPVQISGFLLYAAPSSLVPCPANFSFLVNPPILVCFSSCLSLNYTSLCCGFGKPQAEGQSKHGFHLFCFTSLKVPIFAPSVVNYQKTVVLYILSSYIVVYWCLWWEGKSDVSFSVMATPQATLWLDY